jgi:hypothetical protein
VSGSGRSGTGNARYRRNREILLATTDICALCGHPGAKTANHKIAAALWPKDMTGRPLPGMDELGNLEPAHGTMGSGRARRQNPCPVCGELCNQKRGARIARRPQTRNWFPEG